ncbi:MAG: hypothetical protein JWQ92_3207 [Amnibacterium sp.]|nr:hypothetical protein [Amnibacterium sp.]
MVSIQSFPGSPVAPWDRRTGHFDGECRDRSRAPLGSDTDAPEATGGTRILPVLPACTTVGVAREVAGSH